MDQGDLYDPPLSRRRSASLSAPSYTASVNSRRQSTIDLVPVTAVHSDTDSSTDGGEHDDNDGKPLVRPPSRSASIPSTPAPPYDDSSSDSEDGRKDVKGSLRDASWMDQEDLKTQRPGRMSAGWEEPGTTHSGDAGMMLAQVYDLTHAIDAVDNDIDEIHALRKKISKIDPKEDVGQVSIHADLSALATLTNQTGRSIVSLEQWLTQLHKNTKKMRADMKAGRANFRPQEVGELKFQVASAKLDFADAMERIREGAWQEQERRTRVRIWMARHIRARENDIDDAEVKKLLRASELGAAEGVINNSVTSYSGLWALNNPYTELAELTDGMKFLHDDLDREIVDEIVPRPRKQKAPIDLNKKVTKDKPRKNIFYGSRLSYYSSHLKDQQAAAQDRQIAYLNNEVDGAEKDIEYGYARQQILERSARRKKMVIALLVVLIIGLILLVWFATMNVPHNLLRGDDDYDGSQSIYFSISLLEPTAPVNTIMPTIAEGAGVMTPASSAVSSSNLMSAAVSSASSFTSSLGQAVESMSSNVLASNGFGIIPTPTTTPASSSTAWWTAGAAVAPTMAPVATPPVGVLVRRLNGRWD